MSGGEDRPDLQHTPDTGLQLHRVSALQCCSTQGNSGGRGSFIHDQRVDCLEGFRDVR